MPTSDPFGSPTGELFDFPIPDEDVESPFGPIGAVNPDTGEFEPGTVTVRARCTGWKRSVSKRSGNPMIVCSVMALEGRFVRQEYDIYLVASPAARFKLIETYKAFGLPEDGTKYAPPIGVHCLLTLQDEEYNGRWSPKAKSVAPAKEGVGYRGTADLPPAKEDKDSEIPF